MKPASVTIDVNGEPVPGLLLAPPSALACYVLAHSAGAGMTHPFLNAAAEGLAQRHIATLRYQFPYMAAGRKRPDPPALAHAAVRAAVDVARKHLLGMPLIAGGKSFGGRMTSQAQALDPLPNVVGLAFIGFPLHPAKRPSQDRAKHLTDVTVPMLFLQGTRDALAELDQLRPVCAALANATLELFENADHSFHVPARSGRTDAEVLEALLDTLAEWIAQVMK